MIKRRLFGVPAPMTRITNVGPGKSTISKGRTGGPGYGPESRTVRTGGRAGGRGAVKPAKRRKFVLEKNIPSPKEWDFYSGHINATKASKNVTVTEPGGTTWNVTETPTTPGLTHGPTITLKYEKDKMTLNQSGNFSSPRRVHRSNIETGVPTAKTIMTQGKSDGTIKKLLCDTKLYLTDNNSTVIPREFLDIPVGFNCKSYWFMPGHASPGYLDMMETLLNTTNKATILAWVNQDTTEQSIDKRYASVKNFHTTMSFANESTYLPLNLKIHLIRPNFDLSKENTNPSATARRNYLLNFRDNVFGGNAQSDFAMPARYKATEATIFGQQEDLAVPLSDNYRRTSLGIEMLPGAYLSMSPYFREKFSIIKTVSKKLQPNDSWIFSHKHHFGSGIDIEGLKAHYRDINGVNPGEDLTLDRMGNDTPLTYMFMIEAIGVPCSATVGDSDSLNNLLETTYQGTSPGVYHMEFKSVIEFVTASTTAPFAAGANIPESCHTRNFKKRVLPIATLARPRFITANNIVSLPTALAVNKAYVPIVTDKVVNTDNSRGAAR